MVQIIIMPRWLKRLVKERNSYFKKIIRVKYALENYEKFKINKRQLELLKTELYNLKELVCVLNEKIDEGIKPVSSTLKKDNVDFYNLNHNQIKNESFNLKEALSKINKSCEKESIDKDFFKKWTSKNNNLTLEERIENLANLNKTEIPKEPIKPSLQISEENIDPPIKVIF